MLFTMFFSVSFLFFFYFIFLNNSTSTRGVFFLQTSTAQVLAEVALALVGMGNQKNAIQWLFFTLSVSILYNHM